MLRLLRFIALTGLLVGCASGPRPSTVPAGPPIFDHLIVPGQRVGPISINMTQDQLFAAMGRPTPNDTYVQDPAVFTYVYQRETWLDGSRTIGLEVQVRRKSSKVDWITVSRGNDGFRTKEGLAIGMSRSQVTELMGQPAKVVRAKPHSNETYCYPGLRVTLYENVVNSLEVNGWGCDML